MTERAGNVRQNVNLACESIKKPGKSPVKRRVAGAENTPAIYL